MKVEECYKEGFYEIFKNAFNSIAIFQLVFDENKQPIDFTCIEVNRSFQRIFKIQHPSYVGKCQNDLQKYPVTPSFEKLLQVQHTQSPQSYHFHEKATERYFQVHLYAPRNRIVVAVFQDTTQAIMNTKALKIQNHLGTHVSSLNDEKQVCDEVVKCTIALPFIDACGIYLCDVENQKFELQSSLGFSSTFIAHVQSLAFSSPEGEKLNGMKSPFFGHATDRLIVGYDRYKDENIKAIAILPIEYMGLKIGSLNIASKTHDQFPEEIQKTLTSIIYLIGSTLSRIVEVNKLKSNEEILRETINQSTDGIVIMDATHRIVLCNQVQKNLLQNFSGDSKSLFFWEMLGKMHPIANQTPKKINAYKQWIQKYQNMEEDNPQVLIKMKVENGPYQSNVYEISFFPILLQKERMYGAILRDITKQIEIETLKSSFINTVSHEMRTPLTAIQSSIHLLNDSSVGIVNDKQKELLSISTRNIDRLSMFVYNILDFQKVHDSSFCLTLQNHDITEILKETAHFFSSLALEKGITIHTDVPSSPLIVQVDKKYFQKVLFTLIGNAMKYTSKGSVELRVDRIEKKDKLRIQVIDTGIGLHPYEINDLFHSTSMKNCSENFASRYSSGMNLALSKKIIQLHRGDLWATSEYGKGSIFHIELPYKYNFSEEI
ncbi:MAG: HAMP domain-containing sensor histidine kinase [Caldisericia bacterium]|nr:HAMP domain-containing sensor histidine kinase [Caldisericia bacterium]